MPVSAPRSASGRRPAASRDLSWLFPVDERRSQRQSIIAGIVGTILVHLLFLLIPPSYLSLAEPTPAPAYKEIDITLVSEPEEPPQPVDPRYVETNPDAPENAPDRTDNFSARDQQSANPEVPRELSPDNTPATEGDQPLSEKFLCGELAPPPELSLPPSPESTETSPEVLASNPTQRDPTPGIESESADEGEGAAPTPAPPTLNPAAVSEPIEGTREESTDERPAALGAPTVTERPAPGPRPRLAQITPGPVRQRDAGVSQTGRIGVDAKFSQYGEYLERVVEAVSQRWHALCSSRAYSESNSQVVLEFKLTRDGNVKDMTTLHKTSQALGEFLCRAAVEQGQSYGPWTEDMVRVLGEEQTVTFRFFYW